MRTAVELTSGLVLPLYVVSKDEARKEADKRLTTDTDLAVLKDLCCRKIRRAAEKGELANHSRLLSILYCWKRWGGDKEAESWVAELVASGRVLDFLKSTLQKTTTRRMGDYSRQITEGIPVKYVEDFFPLEKVQEAVEKIVGKPADDRERIALEAWQETWERKKSGKSEKGHFDLLTED